MAAAGDRPRHGRNVMALLIAEVIQKLLTLLLFIALSRKLTIEENGRYAQFVTFLPFLCVLLNAGISDVLVRELSQRPTQAPVLMAKSLLLQIGLAILFLPGLLAIPSALRLPGGILFFAAVYAVSLLAVMGRVLLAGFSARQRFDIVSMLQVGLRTGTVLVSLAALAFGVGVTGLVVVLIPVYALWLAGIALSLIGRRREDTPPSTPAPGASILLRDGIPMAFSGVAATAWFALDMPMMQAICAEMEAGYYAIGMRFMMMLFPLAEVLTTAAYPAICRAAGEGKEALSASIHAWRRVIWLLAPPIAVGGYLLAAPLTVLLAGDRFLPGAPSLGGLTVAFSFFMMIMMALTHLRATGRQREAAWIMVIAVVVKALALGPAIFLKGDTGAIAVNVIGGGISALFLFGAGLRDWRRSDILRFLGEIGRILAATAAMALAIWPLRAASPLVTVLIGMAVYGGAALLFGALRRRDFDSLRSIT